jgi:hypothetical protein
LLDVTALSLSLFQLDDRERGELGALNEDEDAPPTLAPVQP